MLQYLTPEQDPLKRFASQEAAQVAANLLQAHGFSADQMTITSSDYEPDPPLVVTTARRNAGLGAVTGTLFGGLIGLLLGILGLGATVTTELTSLGTVLAIALVGSGIGAGAGSLIAGLTGANVKLADARPNDEMALPYLLFVQGSPEEQARAQALLS